MKIAYVFLPLYFGVFAGFVGHSVRIGLVGAVVGLFLAVLLSREAKRRPDASMMAIDAMTGTEFENYVAARLRRAGWQVAFTPMSGDYGVDLIAEKDGKSVAIQCKRHGNSVGVAAVQQGGLRRPPPRLHQEHCGQQPGIHAGGKAVGLHPRLPVDRS